MNEKEFITQYSGAPIEIIDIATSACREIKAEYDESDIQFYANEFLDARDRFLEALSDAGFELG